MTFLGCVLLLQWRTERSLARWESGARFSINPNQLARYEKGKRPGADLMERMAKISEDEIPILSWFERVPIPNTKVKTDTNSSLATAV